MLGGLFREPDFLNLALRGLTERGDAISENITNADTPGYKRKAVAFERQLQEIRDKMDRRSSGSLSVQLDTPDSGDMTSEGKTVSAGAGPSSDLADFQPTSRRETTTSIRNDGNNVDIDAEMSDLARNEISYNAVADLVKRDFDRLRSVLNG
ncbi:MAG: flagellar basal body rod protein FlgB [Cyanobacteria bacterium REEB65]|nr:flagellar basal body rod protein FlgB [Cyanobacteria bacterium REEB65]